MGGGNQRRKVYSSTNVAPQSTEIMDEKEFEKIEHELSQREWRTSGSPSESPRKKSSSKGGKSGKSGKRSSRSEKPLQDSYHTSGTNSSSHSSQQHAPSSPPQGVRRPAEEETKRRAMQYGSPQKHRPTGGRMGPGGRTPMNRGGPHPMVSPGRQPMRAMGPGRSGRQPQRSMNGGSPRRPMQTPTGSPTRPRQPPPEEDDEEVSLSPSRAFGMDSPERGSRPGSRRSSVDSNRSFQNMHPSSRQMMVGNSSLSSFTGSQGSPMKGGRMVQARGMPARGVPGGGVPGRMVAGRGMPGRGMPGRVGPGRGMPGRFIPGRGMPGRGPQGVPGRAMTPEAMRKMQMLQQQNSLRSMQQNSLRSMQMSQQMNQSLMQESMMSLQLEDLQSSVRNMNMNMAPVQPVPVPMPMQGSMSGSYMSPENRAMLMQQESMRQMSIQQASRASLMSQQQSIRAQQMARQQGSHESLGHGSFGHGSLGQASLDGSLNLSRSRMSMPGQHSSVRMMSRDMGASKMQHSGGMSSRSSQRDGQKKKPTPRELLERKIVERAYHLPGNNWFQDWWQYHMGNHPLFGICCRHPLDPIGSCLRFFALLGSVVFGMTITNVVYILFVLEEADYDYSYYSVGIDRNITSNQEINENLTTLDVTAGIIWLWTVGGALNAVFDHLIWEVASCACFAPGGRFEKYPYCQKMGPLLVIMMTLSVCAAGTLTVLLRAEQESGAGPEGVDTTNATVPTIDSIKATDEVHVVKWQKDLETYSFLMAYIVEMVLSFLLWYPIIGTILFSGVLGCGRLPLVGGRPREMWLDAMEEEKEAAERADEEEGFCIDEPEQYPRY